MDNSMSETQEGDAVESGVILRDVVESDLTIFFEHHKDPDANRMAAFTAKDPADQAAFRAHWDKILGDDEILIQTILYHGDVAGHVLSYVQLGEREVSYWIGKKYWGSRRKRSHSTRRRYCSVPFTPARPKTISGLSGCWRNVGSVFWVTIKVIRIPVV